MRLTFLAAAVTLIAAPAFAEWVYRAPEASDDLGSAYVMNAQGQRLNVGCGNGGAIGVSISPDLRVRMQPGDGPAPIAFRIDGRAPIVMPAECGEAGCVDAYPWEAAGRQALTAALRGGSSVTVTLGPTTLASFSLAGSSAALGRVKETTRCEGL